MYFSQIETEGTVRAAVIAINTVTNEQHCYISLTLFDGYEYKIIHVSAKRVHIFQKVENLCTAMLLEISVKKRTPNKADTKNTFFDLIDLNVIPYQPFTREEITEKKKEIIEILKRELDEKHYNLCLAAYETFKSDGFSMTDIPNGFFEYSYPGGLTVHIRDCLQILPNKIYIVLSMLSDIGAFNYYKISELGRVRKTDEAKFASKRDMTIELVTPIIMQSELNDKEKIVLKHALRNSGSKYCKSSEARNFNQFKKGFCEIRFMEFVQHNCLGDERLGTYLTKYDDLNAE